MLENIPKIVGQALRGARAGVDKIVGQSDFSAAPDSIFLTSPAFAEAGTLPVRFTADGEGVSPSLGWANVPAGCVALVLFIEDPDAPALEPLVHGIAWHLPPGDGSLPEGALAGPAGPGLVAALGKNSFLKAEYLPPDPPTGHGPHRYVFQIFALDRALDLAAEPGRGAVVEAMKGRVLAQGRLMGTYERS